MECTFRNRTYDVKGQPLSKTTDEHVRGGTRACDVYDNASEKESKLCRKAIHY